VARVGLLQFRGGLQLSWPGRRFGGWSDLHVTPDGHRLTAISDEGRWLAADLVWRDGRLLGVRDGELGVIGDGDRCPGKLACDAEGLAALPDGWLVSFENAARVVQFDRQFQHPRPWPLPDLQVARAGNEGLEALTVLPDGRVLTVLEGGDQPQPSQLPAWLGTGQAWQPLQYRTTDGFRPTAWTLLPDSAQVLVLERYYRKPIAQARLSVVTVAQGLVPRELAVLRPPMSVDNFEGVAAIRLDGETRILILSDDNFSGTQRTLLLAFALTEALP
jgi:hypothetical protein